MSQTSLEGVSTADVSSGTEMTRSNILASTGKFDLATVYKLAWCCKGLKTIHGVDRLVNLVELDLSGNNIAQISGLEKCQHLQKLVLAKNKITGLDNLRSLAKLEHLLLQGNPISTIESLNLQQLCKLPRLCTLYLKNVTGAEACHCCHAKDYKRTVLSALPKLKNLDGERNPYTSTYTAVVESATAVQRELTQFEPDFSFTKPKPWIDAGLLQVPEVPPISHYEVVSTLHGRIDGRADWLVQEIGQLSVIIRTRA